MIASFTGHHRFLSNFYPSPIEVDGLVYPTVEHAFQAAKTDSVIEKEKIRRAQKPGTAKAWGKKVTLRGDWEQVKVGIMLSLLRKKFHDKVLRSMLLATGDEKLVEGNFWGDTFWGVYKGKGQNMLGMLLMEVRREVQS